MAYCCVLWLLCFPGYSFFEELALDSYKEKDFSTSILKSQTRTIITPIKVSFWQTHLPNHNDKRLIKWVIGGIQDQLSSARYRLPENLPKYYADLLAVLAMTESMCYKVGLPTEPSKTAGLTSKIGHHSRGNIAAH